MQAEKPPEQPSTAAMPAIAIATVGGEPLRELPRDLYIPPDALEVFLEAFEGPLDLLLYLIKRQNLDILDIPIADVTAQYMKYISLMETMRFELAAEYLLMAAMLAEIKSRMLLPRVEADGDDEDDPRAELIRRLQDYERIKQAAVSLDSLPRLERDVHPLKVVPPVLEREVPVPEVTLRELLMAMKDVAERARLLEHHQVGRETLSVRARMSQVLAALKAGEFCEFTTLFTVEEGRMGVVVTFLAVLELCKESLLDIVQSEAFGPIYLKPKTAVEVSGDADSPEDPDMQAGAEASVYSVDAQIEDAKPSAAGHVDQTVAPDTPGD